MPRLSPVDQAFFLLETHDRPMSIGLLFVLKPPPRVRGNFADRLVRTMLQCPVGPPFSYRLRPGPLPRRSLRLRLARRLDAVGHEHRHEAGSGDRQDHDEHHDLAPAAIAQEHLDSELGHRRERHHEREREEHGETRHERRGEGIGEHDSVTVDDGFRKKALKLYAGDLTIAPVR